MSSAGVSGAKTAAQSSAPPGSAPCVGRAGGKCSEARRGAAARGDEADGDSSSESEDSSTASLRVSACVPALGPAGAPRHARAPLPLRPGAGGALQARAIFCPQNKGLEKGRLEPAARSTAATARAVCPCSASLAPLRVLRPKTPSVPRARRPAAAAAALRPAPPRQRRVGRGRTRRGPRRRSGGPRSPVRRRTYAQTNGSRTYLRTNKRLKEESRGRAAAAAALRPRGGGAHVQAVAMPAATEASPSTRPGPSRATVRTLLPAGSPSTAST
jgi:hypothetical protein